MKDYSSLESFVLYVCIDGYSMLHYNGNERLPLNLGEAVLIPAVMEQISIYPEKNTKILEIYIQ